VLVGATKGLCGRLLLPLRAGEAAG
jgi:hypothetical protein